MLFRQNGFFFLLCLLFLHQLHGQVVFVSIRLRHCLATNKLSTEPLIAPADCLLHYSPTPSAVGASGFQWSCSTQLLPVLGHGVGKRGRQLIRDFKASTWKCTRPSQLITPTPSLVCAPGLERSISLTVTAQVQPGALRLKYQLVSPLHRLATEYRHEVTNKWKNSAVNGSSH